MLRPGWSLLHVGLNKANLSFLSGFCNTSAASYRQLTIKKHEAADGMRPHSAHNLQKQKQLMSGLSVSLFQLGPTRSAMLPLFWREQPQTTSVAACQLAWDDPGRGPTNTATACSSFKKIALSSDATRTLT
jgi:hypothetical protein